ncbi:MAG: AbrB/MazE/SpoVT family DNA-binding domain-containing protein [Acidobacteriota bacterium]
MAGVDYKAALASAGCKTVSYGLMKTTVSSKGQIVLPAEIRQQDRIEPGQEFEVERLDRGEYRLLRRTARPNEGVVDWLLACPEKGFFVPIESESTDEL